MDYLEIKNKIITVLFNEKTDNLKIDLEDYKLFLPAEGFFIALLNLGPADENKNLTPTSPFKEILIDGKTKRFSKHIKPYFPVNFKKPDPYTYVRYTFNEDKSRKQFDLRKQKNSRINNINIGYELKVYE
jgi:hypothetical protein